MFSKVWFPINHGVPGLGDAGRSFPIGVGSFQEFPAQAWFLSFGAWTSNGMLFVQPLAPGLVALALRRVLGAR